MQVISKPLKFMPFQITKIIDNFNVEKINIRVYSRMKGGGFNFSKAQNLYLTMEDWDLLKRQLKGARKKKE